MTGRMDFSPRRPWPGLGRLFEGDAFAFRFHLRPGREGWLGRGEPGPGVLEERGRLLEGNREEVFVWTDAADAAWSDVEGLLEPGLARAAAGRTARERAVSVSRAWAPDFVLMDRGPEEFGFAGGSVCFPSGWDAREKVGKGLAAVHGPVPGLNEQLGARIATFLDRLQPGCVFERENWGLAATNELDLHPARGRPRLGGRGMESVWFRLEEQAFVRCGPGGRTLLFLIHIRVWPLAEVLEATGAGESFWRMMRTIPPEVARYKGLSGFRLPGTPRA